MRSRVKDYTELTYLGQVRRLSRLGKLALMRYDFEAADISLINHGENTTYRVRFAEGSLPAKSSPAYADTTCLLRIHRTGYNNQDSIASELIWLAALREAGYTVPEPIPAEDGALFVRVTAPGIPEERICSLLRWMNGRFYAERAKPAHYYAVGKVMAHLHAHAMQWSPPAGFTRRRWDWEGLFGDESGFNLPAEEVWSLLPNAQRETYRAVAARARSAMNALGEGPDSFGLIHADLHLWNVVFGRDDGEWIARPLDFDDCGYSHWIYDFASALSDDTANENWQNLRDALLAGYIQIAPLPQGISEYLDIFMAARIVSLILWAADMSLINARIRAGLPNWIGWADRCLANIPFD